MVKVEIDLQVRIFAVANPLAIEGHQVVRVRFRGGGTLDVDEQIPIARLVIERNNQVQRMPRERLPRKERNFVLPDSYVVCNTGVESAGQAGHDVDVVTTLLGCCGCHRDASPSTRSRSA